VTFLIILFFAGAAIYHTLCLLGGGITCQIMFGVLVAAACLVLILNTFLKELKNILDKRK